MLRRDPEQGTRILSRQLRGHQHFTVAKPEPMQAAPIGLVAAAQTRVFGRRQAPDLLPAFHKDV